LSAEGHVETALTDDPGGGKVYEDVWKLKDARQAVARFTATAKGCTTTHKNPYGNGTLMNTFALYSASQFGDASAVFTVAVEPVDYPAEATLDEYTAVIAQGDLLAAVDYVFGNSGTPEASFTETILPAVLKRLEDAQ
jgi:hypothetical protein